MTGKTLFEKVWERHVVTEQAQHVRRCLDHVGAGTVNALHARITQELIVAGRDHTARRHLDVGPACFLQQVYELGNQGLVSRGQ